MNILNKYKKAVLLLVGIIVSTLPTFATIYEDAEDLKTTGWKDTTRNLNTTIANIYDSQKESRVIELRGNGKNTIFSLGATESVNSNSWNNSTEKQLKWSMNYSESFSIYIPISTEKGKRFLVYTNQGTDKKGKIRGGKVRYGLGEDSIDGTWHTFTRDLEADWNAFEPDNPYIKVHGFFIRGSGRVDDISLSQKAIEPTTENNSTDWVVYGDTTDAIIETVEDIERGSSVIKLTAHGENTGFRLGNRAGRASYVGAWHNQTEKILQWSMKYDEPFTIYIPITTEHGNRFLTYTNQSEDKKGKVRGGKVSYGLGEDSIDGTWHTFTRDLEADWNAFMPNDPFVAVNGFFIKGSGYVADVMTLNSSNPTTTEPAIKIKKTGQIVSYYKNDDGDNQKGVTPSYTRNDAKEIVTDNITKLQWQDNIDAKKIYKTWEDANEYCERLTLGGYYDWRLPKINELQSIVLYKNNHPTIDTTVFKNYNTYDSYSSYMYWSSTLSAEFPSEDAMIVQFFNGYTDDNVYIYRDEDDIDTLRVRCVRGGEGEEEETSRYTRTDGVVTDSKTTLEWQDDYSDNGGNIKHTNWSDAIDYCEALSLNGKDDWRLPNINELLSIVNYTAFYERINPIFQNTFRIINHDDSQDWDYWSSTTTQGNKLGVNFFGGLVYPFSSNNNVRCVRGGE